MLKEFDPNEIFDKVTEEMFQYVLARDENICQLCGRPAGHAHHIIFKSLGGKNKANNLALLCYKCHVEEDGVHRHGVKENVVQLLLGRVKENEKRLRERLI